MAEQPFTIREVSFGELAKVVECLHAAFAPYKSAYTQGAYQDTTLSLATMKQRHATMSVLVAVDGTGAIVGTISLCKEPDASGHIRGMAVQPEWQGQGVAAALLRAAEDALRERGCARVHLETTEPLQTAIDFYERKGFRRTGRVSDFFGMALIEYSKAL